MKEYLMSGNKWRTVQIFLSSNGVSEVEVNLDSGDVSCNCPGFVLRSSCKHSRLVEERVKDNGGTYPLKVSSKAPQDAADQARLNKDDFRNFVIKYGKVEVI